MNCIRCNSACVKWGKQAKTGQQRYRCKSCKRLYQKHYTYKAYCPTTHEQFRKFQHFGVSYRLISKFLGISRNTLSKWILKALNIIPNDFITKGGLFEIDELKTYVGNKTTGEVWVAYGWSVNDKKPVGLSVGKRSAKALKPIVKELHKHQPEKITTDGLASYKVIIPTQLHQVGKHLANHIERNHVTLRKNISFLIRKTICYAKNLQQLKARIMWCFWGESNPNFFLEE